MPSLTRRLRLPRRTVRLRLTLLYGGLFLASGLALLILTNVLVRHATSEVLIGLQRTAAVGDTEDATAPETRMIVPAGQLRAPAGTDPAVVRLLDAQAQEFRAAALAQREAQRRQLLIQSGVALGVMAVFSMALGWWVAGRVLRPLRTITAAAREISATNLHERLALRGPNDELKELGDTIDQLLGRLEKTFEAQRQFVANASHELRTPLARQRTLIEVALSDPAATADSLRGTHERVLASGEEQERLIQALLTLARSERGLGEARQVDLAEVAADGLAQAASEIERRNLDITVDLEPAPVAGDRELLERLLDNLLDNAMRYNNEERRIELTTGVRDGAPFLKMSNTGARISTGEVEGLFEPFRRLGGDRLRHAGGHGLGLSIVRAIAEAHGAVLRASPRAAGGLTVEVAFAPALPAPGC